jgi:hypothetical protein
VIWLSQIGFRRAKVHIIDIDRFPVSKSVLAGGLDAYPKA